MNTRHASWPGLAIAIALTLGCALPAHAVSGRPDAIWARSTNGAPITLDGNMNEPAWAVADSVIINYGVDTGPPGSGWKPEGGHLPSDPTHAVLKFLTVGNVLYMGAKVSDKSVGGSATFNFFDGLLMDLKNHADPGSPKPVSEYFWSWWNDQLVGTPPLNQAPTFYGTYGENPHGTPRTPAQIAAWDAAYIVDGTVNEDSVHAFSPKTLQNDNGYTVEMKFDLASQGYDVTGPNGDILE
jgi:hypothetical protein